MRPAFRRPAFHWFRRGVQFSFLALFVVLAWAATYPPGRIPENIFLRFDPLVGLVALMAGATLLFLLPAGLLLAITAFSGRFFCGWICPLGTSLELIPSLQKHRRRRQKLSEMKPRDLLGRPIEAGERRLRAKYLFLAILVVLLLAGVNLIWIFDPLVIANRAVSFVLTGIIPFILISLVVLGILAGPRFWCQEMCPLGAGLSLASMAGSRLPAGASPLTLVKDDGACTHCGACVRACPFEIMEVGDSRRTGRLAMADCALCGECVTACPQAGALNYQIMGKTVLGSKGSEAGDNSVKEVEACAI